MERRPVGRADIWLLLIWFSPYWISTGCTYRGCGDKDSVVFAYTYVAASSAYFIARVDQIQGRTE